MKISIGLTTYNGAAYLQAQLNSYLVQEKLPDELVVCDDLSADETVTILEAFKKTAPFQVRIIINECNLGFTKNFEKALLNCSGDLIFLSDQDDVWFPEKIRIIEDTFKKHPNKYLIVHDGDLVDENLVSHGATKRGQVIAGYGSDDHLCTGALTAVRKDLIEYALPIPEKMTGHDGWLHGMARLLGKRMVLNQSLQLIRRHSKNTSAWVASSVKPINRFSVAGSQFSTTAADTYVDRLVYNSNLTHRLKSLASRNLEEVAKETVSNAIALLEGERKAIFNREELLQLGYFKKKTQAIKMLIHGDYSHFNGVKSFFRDFFR